MADEADYSVEQQAQDLKIALQRHQSKSRQGTRPYTGFCHYCNKPQPEPKRFCDDDCKEDQLYDEERRARLYK